ncbi:MAG: ABC transporter permease [Scardovia wiggsiae]|uniref:ABC transporter permease n=1 Tax=Scardovia wiggsiae TaxID=230143 RepID=UPI003616B326
MKTSLRSHKALLKWSFLRHRYLFVSFTVLQIMFALAIVYGLTLMLDMSGGQSAQNVNTGVWQLCLITIGCNLAPQMMAGSISEGFMEYQSNLPVSRVGILLSDWLIWALVSAPGVAAAILAGWARFGLVPQNPGLLILLLLLCMLVNLSFGYTMALWFPPDTVTIVGQAVMFVAMLFSPILYSSDKLPHFIVAFHNCLPFVPMHRLILAAAFPGSSQMNWPDLAVVLVWLFACSGICVAGLYKRK